MNEALLKKVKRIEISTRRLMDDLQSGGYKSHFKGHGVQFSEHRQYTPGDDIRHLDWKVSARSKEPLVKQYEEERELSVMIIADLSASLEFGSHHVTKREVVADLGAMIAYAASNSGDKVGVMFVDEQIRKVIQLKKGKNHVLRIIRDLLSFETAAGGTHLKKALEQTRKVMKQSGIIFILSDFKTSGYEVALKQLSRKHDIVAVKIEDPQESQLLPIGTMSILDPESGKEMVIDSHQFMLQKELKTSHENFETKTKQTLNSARVETLTVSTHEDYAEKLIQFFKRRKQKR